MPKIVLAITNSISTTLIEGQARYLAKQGFDVYLVSGPGERASSYAQAEACTLVTIPFMREISPAADIRSLYETVKTFRRIRPNIVNAGTPKAGLVCMLAAYVCRIDVRIFTLRGIRSTALRSRLKRRVVRWMESLTGKFATNIISISPSMTQYAIENGLFDGKKIVTLGSGSSNGIDASRFDMAALTEETTKALRRSLHIDDDKLVIGFVGRVVRSKGVVELYQAFRKLSQAHNNLVLLIVGSIEQSDDAVPTRVLQDMKNDPGVVFSGRIENVEYAYALMDVFALPSQNFREGFGNVALEASAMGLPIIVSRGAGCQDAVEHEKTGFLVESGDPISLANALNAYVASKSLRKRHGLQGSNRVKSLFTNSRIWNEQLNLYRRLLEGSAPSNL